MVPSESKDLSIVGTENKEERFVLGLGRLALILGLVAFLVSVALTVRTYMPCPFWDEWSEISPVAHGAGFSSWGWLWSQHNEHRILITRLLLLADLQFFGGKNISLLIEMYLTQALLLAAICHAVERFTNFPRYLKTTLDGLFAFCLFHPNQAQNLTWPFQVSFILAFAIATFAFLAIAFFERFRLSVLVVIGLSLAPLLAALNVAGGLLIGPVSIAFAIFKRLRVRHIVAMTALFSASTVAYLTGYYAADPKHPPFAALRQVKDILVYVLTYFGASWTRLLPHKERVTCLISFVCFGFLTVRAVRNRSRTSNFEWFCIAECVFMIATASVTAIGRLQFGVGQAYAGRYQTPAMLYWGSLCALALINFQRYRPMKFRYLQTAVLIILLLSTATYPWMWTSIVKNGDALRNACYVVMHGDKDERAAKLLFPIPQHMTEAIQYLHRVWRE